MRLFHRHKYQIVATQPGMYAIMGTMCTTVILYRCRCGRARSENLNGNWTVEQLRGERIGDNQVIRGRIVKRELETSE